MIPTILLTVFLGSGKTTVLNAILKFLKPQKLNIALLINEFGNINVDAELIDSYYKKIFFVEFIGGELKILPWAKILKAETLLFLSVIKWTKTY